MSLQAFSKDEAAEFSIAARVAEELASLPQGYQIAEHEFTGLMYFKQLVEQGVGITQRQVNYRLKKLVNAGVLNMKKETIGRNETNVYWWPGEGADDRKVDAGTDGNGADLVKD